MFRISNSVWNINSNFHNLKLEAPEFMIFGEYRPVDKDCSLEVKRSGKLFCSSRESLAPTSSIAPPSAGKSDGNFSQQRSRGGWLHPGVLPHAAQNSQIRELHAYSSILPFSFHFLDYSSLAPTLSFWSCTVDSLCEHGRPESIVI